MAPPESLPDQGDAVEAERVEEIDDEPGDTRGSEVGVRVHRGRVRAQRQVGDDAAEVGRQPLGDALPEAAVDQQAVEEDERLAGAAVAVADRALGERRLFHTACMYHRYSLYVNAVRSGPLFAASSRG